MTAPALMMASTATAGKVKGRIDMESTSASSCCGPMLAISFWALTSSSCDSVSLPCTSSTRMTSWHTVLRANACTRLLGMFSNVASVWGAFFSTRGRCVSHGGFVTLSVRLKREVAGGEGGG